MVRNDRSANLGRHVVAVKRRVIVDELRPGPCLPPSPQNPSKSAVAVRRPSYPCSQHRDHLDERLCHRPAHGDLHRAPAALPPEVTGAGELRQAQAAAGQYT